MSRYVLSRADEVEASSLVYFSNLPAEQLSKIERSKAVQGQV
jgi:hypothetical protein